MDEDRQTLHALIVALYPGLNLYFRPQNTLTLVYPCIVYDHINHTPLYSNNMAYTVGTVFQVTLMDRVPAITVDTRPMFDVRGCTFENTFTQNDIVHNVYVIVIN